MDNTDLIPSGTALSEAGRRADITDIVVFSDYNNYAVVSLFNILELR